MRRMGSSSQPDMNYVSGAGAVKGAVIYFRYGRFAPPEWAGALDWCEKPKHGMLLALGFHTYACLRVLQSGVIPPGYTMYLNDIAEYLDRLDDYCGGIFDGAAVFDRWSSLSFPQSEQWWIDNFDQPMADRMALALRRGMPRFTDPPSNITTKSTTQDGRTSEGYRAWAKGYPWMNIKAPGRMPPVEVVNDIVMSRYLAELQHRALYAMNRINQFERLPSVETFGFGAKFRPGCYVVTALGAGGKTVLLRHIHKEVGGSYIHAGEADPGTEGPHAAVQKLIEMPGSLVILDSLVEVGQAYADNRDMSIGFGKGGEPLGHIAWSFAASRQFAYAHITVLASYPSFFITEDTLNLIKARSTGLIVPESPDPTHGSFEITARGGARDTVTYNWSSK